MLRQVGTTVLSFLAFFILLFIYTKLAGPIPFVVTSSTSVKTDIFTVTGEGQAEAKPDSANVRLGVQAQGQTAQAAQEEINTNINKVVSAVKDLGIGVNDIQTENYHINPINDFSDKQQKITGYNASTNINVKVKQIGKADGVLDAATAAGANQVGGVTFDITNKDQAEQEARDKAVVDAKKKAEVAAKAAGFKLGKIVSYSENTPNQPPVVYSARSVDISPLGGGTKIQPGVNEVAVSVTLGYEVK